MENIEQTQITQPQTKVDKRKQSSKENAAKAREAKLAKLREQKENAMNKARASLNTKENVIPEVEESDETETESESEEEILYVKPVERKPRTKKVIIREDESTKREIEELKKQLEQFKKPEPIKEEVKKEEPKPTMKDQLLEEMKFKLLRF
jgi:hypothetical protein